MYSNNARRKLDTRGRLVIPKYIRDVFDLETGQVEIFTENDLICIRKVADSANGISQSRPSARGTSYCNYCICSSCNGFGCPWVARVYQTGWSIGQRNPERCRLCVQKRFERIHDCDFYTAKKRKKFYVKRSLRRPSQHEIIIRELSELKKMLKRPP